MFPDAFLHLNRPELSAGSGPSPASCDCPRHPWCWIPCPGVSCGRVWTCAPRYRRAAFLGANEMW
eukprot:251769-Chlamydomonas_euryale.AAC.1